MSLRVQINLVLSLIICLMAAALIWQQVSGARTSVNEEMETASRVATQVLSRVNEVYRDEGPEAMAKFLERLGRVRANDIVLYDEQGRELYRSPASTYRPDQQAPAWFAALIAPVPQSREFELSRGRLVVSSEASRAVLDGWDEFKRLVSTIGIGFIVLAALSWWLVGRATRPLHRISAALAEVERGGYETRLPTFPGAEANALGAAFNRMVVGVSDSIALREAEARTAAELAKHRELSEIFRQRVERESGELARELHDELGQHVTAIKSMGVSIARRVDDDDPAISQAARLIVESADRIHLAVRGMLNRLRPVSLDQFGLGDALTDLVSDLRLQFPDKNFVLRIGPEMERVDPLVATTAFRVAQESMTNALRHANATAIDVNLRRLENTLVLQVEDNGQGMDEKELAKGGFGLAGMHERVASAGGRLELGRSRQGGVLVRARLPLPDQDAEPRAVAG